MNALSLVVKTAGRSVRRHRTSTSAGCRPDSDPGYALITSPPITADTAVDRSRHRAQRAAAKTWWRFSAGEIDSRPPLADPAALADFVTRVIAAFPDLRLPGPERFQPDRPDWCICAVTLVWTDDQGWVHLVDRRPCPLPRGTWP